MSAFEVLSPHDFEKLIRDLLQAEWGVRLESFSPGKDGGTDLRLLRRSELRTIQCKHHPNVALSSVQSKLRVEAKKLTGRALGEYWLATSARATPASKSTAAAIFVSQGLRPERILAEEDIKNLLNDHQSVHRAHMKLYLSDITALQAVLNNAIHSRQEFLDDRIVKQLKYFVASDAVAEVDRVLRGAGACIVTGPPGVGKTSLAESIAAAHALDGYEIFEVFSAREVEQVWKKKAKQLFLYDDFLGQTGLVEKLDRGEDRSLEHIFKRVSLSGTHKIILTTREYILTAARGIYSTLNGAPFVRSNVVVDIGTYSDFQKAHILYNHLYYSRLGVVARRSVQRDRNYIKAVRHVNYNPRLIESIIAAALAAGGESAAGGFARFMLQSFDSPGGLWRDVFRVELSDSQRAIALLAGTSSYPVDREDLLVHANRFLEEHGSALRVTLRDLDVLEGIFLDIDVDQRSRHVIRPKNPGIRDFLVGCLASDTRNLAAYLSSAPPRALSELITLFSSRGVTASRPWKEASKPDREATAAVMATHLPHLLVALDNAEHAGRAVADLCNIFEQSTRGLTLADRTHLVPALRRAVEVSSASDVAAAYISLLPHMSDDDSRAILEDIRGSWGEDMDIDDIPAALDLERAVEGDSVDDLEYRLLSNISYALDDYANLGFASRSEMLDVVSGYLDWVEGDQGDIPSRIEEMRQAEWEPDDDEYDRYREFRDASEGSVSDIHSLFGTLT